MFGFLTNLMGQKEPASKLATATPDTVISSPARVAIGATPIQTHGRAGSGELIDLPLKAILDRMPAASKSVFSGHGLVSDSLPVPLKTVLSQLPSGRIRISVRELRQVAPPNLFTASTGQDELSIELPLAEVLSRLKPSQLPRRAGQKQVEVAKEISPIFGSAGRIADPTRDGPARESGQSREEQARPMAVSSNLRGDSISSLSQQLPYVAEPASSAQNFAAPIQKHDAPSDTVLTLSMASIMETWPETVRRTLAQGDFQKSVVDLSWVELERELKRGKVQFAWKQLCCWIKPPPSSANAMIDGELVLELPLPMIASAFMARRKLRSPSKRQDLITTDIPNLFASIGPTAAAVAPTVPSSDPQPASQTATPENKQTVPELGDVFGQSDKRSWSPTEIVERTARLEGVAGALLATLDGLLIVGRLPPELSGDKIAAFVPMMFARMAQYSRELNLGDPSHLTFHIEEFPMQVFKAGRVYFTALGRPGQALPRTQLAAIAAALGRPATS